MYVVIFNKSFALDTDKINGNLQEVQRKTEETKSTTDHAISVLNGIKSTTEYVTSDIKSKLDSLISQMGDSHGSVESVQSVDEMKHHVTNLVDTMGTNLNSTSVLLKDNQKLLKLNSEQLMAISAEIRAIVLNNSHKLDQLVKSSHLIQTTIIVAIFIPFVILLFINTLPKICTKRFREGHTSVPRVIEGRPLSVSPASQINSDYENDPELGLEGSFESLAEEHHTFSHNSRQDDWTFDPTYFTRRITGSVTSTVTNIYHSIKSIASNRRPTIKNYLQNTNDAIEVQGLLVSDTEDETENDNPAFEAKEINPDYPLAMMAKITDYDTKNTKEEKIQNSVETVPYSFTSFKVYNESVQGSCRNSDSSETGAQYEVCCTSSTTPEEDTLEELWQKLGGKDYDNMPSTSESTAGSIDTEK